MRYCALVSMLLLALQAPASAALMQLQVTYTSGEILSGELSADLTELPESVQAFFIVEGSFGGVFTIADVVEASLAFGDVTWNAADLQSFSTDLVADGDELFVTALTYEFAPKSTSAVNDRIAGNFPLEIMGTDNLTMLDFHYLYDQSTQTVVVVPEPVSVALLVIGFAAAAGCSRRGRQRA